jgi:phage repressor protein C with HTH and peptisase S24 domain
LEQVLSDVIFRRVTATAESQVYRDLIGFKPEGLSANAWAVKAGVSRTVWSDMRRHGNPSRRTLEKLLIAAGSSLAEFEALRVGPEAARPAASVTLADPGREWASAPLPRLPLIASSLAGEWGEPGSQVELTEVRPGELLERVARPASLASDPDAFAVTVVGDAMWPRFRPGARVAVSPRSPVAIGDDVLVRLRPARGDVGRVLIKQLVKRSSGTVELRQFNPDLTFAVDAEEVEAILRIPGELI